MKIRWDFVTNSSSTSFVIMCRGEPSKDVFLQAMGAKEGSPLRPLFERLFEILCEHMTEAKHAIRGGGYWAGAGSVAELMRREVSDQAAREADRAAKQGLNVYIGRLSSDEEELESFFCCEAFEVDHPKLRINALNCAW